MSRARQYAKGPQLREYVVTLPDCREIVVQAHYCFNNADDGRGLIFRRFIDDNTENKTYVVAEFATGFWASYREVN